MRYLIYFSLIFFLSLDSYSQTYPYLNRIDNANTSSGRQEVFDDWYHDAWDDSRAWGLISVPKYKFFYRSEEVNLMLESHFADRIYHGDRNFFHDNLFLIFFGC